MIDEEPDLKPILRRFYRAILVKDFDAAYLFDLKVMERLVKERDSESLWETWQSLTYSLRVDLSKRTTREKNRTKDSIPTFLVYNYSGLAHEIQLRYQITMLPNKRARILYAYGSQSKEAKEFYSGLQVDLAFLMCDPSRPYNSLNEKLSVLEEKLGSIHITVVTSYVLAFWASITCNQHSFGFYAMRFIPYQISSISRWIAGGSGDQIMLHNEPWEVISRPWMKSIHVKKFIYDPSVRKLRIGSISREAKIDNPRYLSIVCRILKSFPNVNFLVTGKILRPTVIEFLAKYGLKDRIDFVGWVEPADGMSKIDIYIEPFPFGGGEMLYQAIANEIPFIYLTQNIGLNLQITDHYLRSLFSDSALSKHRAKDEEDLFSKSAELINSIDVYSNSAYWRDFKPSDVIADRCSKNSDLFFEM